MDQVSQFLWRDIPWRDAASWSLAWALTYWLHSTLLLSAAWLLTRQLGSERDRLKEFVWKFALLGGLVTACLQVGLFIEPLGGRWEIATVASAENTVQSPLRQQMADAKSPLRSRRDDTKSPAHPIPTKSSPQAEASFANAERMDDASEQPREQSNPRDQSSAAASPVIESSPDSRPEPKLTGDFAHSSPGGAASVAPSGAASKSAVTASGWLLGLWFVIGGAGVLLFAGAWLHLEHRLARASHEIDEGELRETLTRLCGQAGLKQRVRLTCSPRISGPLALGLWRPRICLPLRAVTDLTPNEQETMLAHEVAHLVRRDPAWLAGSRLLEIVFFFQPLNRLARLRLQESAEFLCDAWAVEQTGQNLTLARCLAEVAGWILLQGQTVGAVGMAESKSALGRRIRRLLADRRPAADRLQPRLALLLLLLIPAVALAIPGATAARVMVKETPAVRSVSGRALAAGDSAIRKIGPQTLVETPRTISRDHEPETFIDPARVASLPKFEEAFVPAFSPPRGRTPGFPEGNRSLTEDLAGLDREAELLRAEIVELEQALRELPKAEEQFALLLANVRRQVQNVDIKRQALRRVWLPPEPRRPFVGPQAIGPRAPNTRLPRDPFPTLSQREEIP